MKDLTTIIVLSICNIAFWIFVGYNAAQFQVYNGCKDTQFIELFGSGINCSVRTSDTGGYEINPPDGEI